MRQLLADNRWFALAALVTATLAAAVTLLAGQMLGTGNGAGERAAKYPVVGKFAPNDTKLSECWKLVDQPGTWAVRNRQGCWEQAYGNVVYHDTPAKAIKLLEQHMEKDPKSITNCHRVSHVMGAAAFTRFGEKVGLAMQEGTLVCSSGYYHGIVERALLDVPVSALGTTGDAMCKEAKEGSNTNIQCYHGLGHGLMLHTNYNLPQSLQACRVLAQWGDRDGCYSGVFMENSSGNYGIKSPWLRDRDLLYPCNNRIVHDEAKRICYTSVAARIAASLDWRLEAVPQWCRRAPDPYSAVCFQNFGEIVGERMRYDPAYVRSMCPLAGAHLTECFRGAAGSGIGATGKAHVGARVCLGAPANVVADCWYVIGERLGETTSGTKEDVPFTCAELTKVAAYRKRCVGGTNHSEMRELMARGEAEDRRLAKLADANKATGGDDAVRRDGAA